MYIFTVQVLAVMETVKHVKLQYTVSLTTVGACHSVLIVPYRL